MLKGLYHNYTQEILTRHAEVVCNTITRWKKHLCMFRGHILYHTWFQMMLSMFNDTTFIYRLLAPAVTFDDILSLREVSELKWSDDEYSMEIHFIEFDFLVFSLGIFFLSSSFSFCKFNFIMTFSMFQSVSIAPVTTLEYFNSLHFGSVWFGLFFILFNKGPTNRQTDR